MKTVTWLALVYAARACAQGLCDTASFNRNPITGQGGVDGRTVITGQLFQLGDFDDCLYRQQAAYCLARVYLLPTNITSPVSMYIREHGQRWTHWRRDSVRWAVCVPPACRDAASLQLSLEAALEPAGRELGIVPTVSLRPEDCQTSASDPPPLTPADYFLGGLLSLIVILVLIGTLHDISQDLVSPNSRKRKYKHNNDGVLRCFSVRANLARLCSDCKEPSLAAIQGMRFLVLFAVIAGHCIFVNAQGAVANISFLEEHYGDWTSAVFLNGHLVVSAFFVISGFLRGYHLLQEGSVLSSVFLRYLRLTPPLAVTVALAASWLHRLGAGPYWHQHLGRVATDCRAHWWTNLLYLNNQLHLGVPCLQHTWYLGADWQLFLASLLVAPLLRRWPGRACAVLGASVLVSVLLCFLHTYVRRLRATLLPVPAVLQNLTADDTFLHGYTSTLCNAAPYFVGLSFGVAYHRLNNTGVNKLWIVTWWAMLVPLLAGPLWSVYFVYEPGYDYGHLLESCYAALHKLPFAYAVASAITLFGLGYGWVVGDVLSCRASVVLGRLTYCAYLVHFLWQKAEAGSRRSPFHLSVLQITRASLLDLVVSYVLGLLLCLSVEMPTTALVARLARGTQNLGRRPQISQSGPEPAERAPRCDLVTPADRRD
ncbi:nose resistant to fluoxetine protein 6-like isoform X3 [Bacillus rossius redtenbacheri]